jgi:hypothetical protein
VTEFASCAKTTELRRKREPSAEREIFTEVPFEASAEACGSEFDRFWP